MKIETGTEMDGVYAYSHGVSRKYALTTEQLIDHLRCVGDAIKEDAARLSIRAEDIFGITISAEIVPATEITIIKYSIERYADPRIKRREDKDG